MLSRFRKYLESGPAIDQLPADGGYFRSDGTWDDDVQKDALSRVEGLLNFVQQPLTRG